MTTPNIQITLIILLNNIWFNDSCEDKGKGKYPMIIPMQTPNIIYLKLYNFCNNFFILVPKLFESLKEQT